MRSRVHPLEKRRLPCPDRELSGAVGPKLICPVARYLTHGKTLRNRGRAAFVFCDSDVYWVGEQVRELAVQRAAGLRRRT